MVFIKKDMQLEQLNKRIEIYDSKKKLTLLFIVSVLFVLGMVMMIPEDIDRGNILGIAIDVAGIILFSFSTIYAGLNFFNKKPKIIIDDIGIIDYSTAITVTGYIFWADINKISTWKHKGNKMILIHVKDPQSYINNETNARKRITMKINNKIFVGTPISLATTTLNISHAELYQLLTERLNEYRQGNRHE